MSSGLPCLPPSLFARPVTGLGCIMEDGAGVLEGVMEAGS